MASHVENADRILDELEELANSSTADAGFVDQVLESMRSLLRAEGTGLVVAVQEGRWAAISVNGKLGSETVEMLSTRIADWGERQESLDTALVRGANSSGPSWVAHAIQQQDFRLGCLVVSYAQPIPTASFPAIAALLKAFSEVMAIRQVRRSERFLRDIWGHVQEAATQVMAANEVAIATHTYAYRLCSLLGAARVTLFRDDGYALRARDLLACSNATSPDRRSEVSEAIRAIAERARTSQQPVFPGADARAADDASMAKSEMSPNSLFPHSIATRLNDLPLSVGRGYLIVLEWSNRAAMIDALPALANAFPFLSTILVQQVRWLSLPTMLRNSSGGWGRRWLPRFALSAVRWLIFAVLCAGLLWFLQKPAPMIIEAQAIVEPSIKRSIFVHVDGLLEELFVEDGQRVVEGQSLATLRSPILDLEIEEVVGQIRAIGEKRNGLRVAVSQVSSTSSDAESVQTRLSAEILLLEEQEKHARDKLHFLNEERKKLAILAPISGVVVARDLAKELESRPLRRGDSLFSIVDLDGPWQLQIQVADRDSGYVVRSREDGLQKVKFVLDSLPKESFEATIKHVGGSIENPKGDLCFLPVFAELESDIAKRAHMGANARVEFSCGLQPYWFVWCRPLLETIQQRYGFFTETRKK